MEDRRPSTDPNDSDPTDRALLRGILRFFVAVALIGALAFGAVLFAPTVIDDLGGVDEFESPNGVDIGTQPSPSSDPPPAGDRDPNVTDPDDPGNSTYDADVETIDSETVEDFVHAEVNERRAEHGLEPLEWDGTVASVSRAHSYDMAERDYFDHVTPDGEQPMDRFNDVDDYCRGYGENIALTYIDRPVQNPDTDETDRHETAEELANGLVDQWMNSTPHRQAILEEDGVPDWDRAGVGVYLTDDGEAYASHNFCREY
ncbi:CAP domain-containing protein [Natronorubrum sp. DTA28]|uniref:CAP domain-containing protein n=1 Tax=Natronorubrum sp. DTA28 TaxID=3447019 RepID=UPI003F8609FD